MTMLVFQKDTLIMDNGTLLNPTTLKKAEAEAEAEELVNGKFEACAIQ